MTKGDFTAFTEEDMMLVSFAVDGSAEAIWMDRDGGKQSKVVQASLGKEGRKTRIAAHHDLPSSTTSLAKWA